MELFDVLDAYGNFTGETIDRDTAHKNGAWHRAVALYIMNDKNQVLMQKRSKHKKTWPGCWDFACGGHVEAGELALGAVISEALEEIGIELKPSDVRYMCGYLSDNKHGTMWDRHINEYFVAFKNINIGDIKLQESEVDEIKWVDFAEFKRIVQNREADKITSKWEAHDALIRYFDRYGRN